MDHVAANHAIDVVTNYIAKLPHDSRTETILQRLEMSRSGLRHGMNRPCRVALGEARKLIDHIGGADKAAVIRLIDQVRH